MNPQTFAQDFGGDRARRVTSSTTSTRADARRSLLTRDDIERSRHAADRDLRQRNIPTRRQRQLYKNIVYVGALAALLDIELDGDRDADRRAVQGQGASLIAANLRRAQDRLSTTPSRASDCPTSRACRVRRSDAVGDRILAEGNFAAGLGAVYGGATVCAWYPITPSTSLAEAFERNCASFRTDPATGKKNYAIVQAEDEIAAIGIAIGAGWNGARAFTATSGPRHFARCRSSSASPISRKFRWWCSTCSAAARRPACRRAPSNRTSSSCAFASHGDTKHVLLIPDGPGEAFEFAAERV